MATRRSADPELSLDIDGQSVEPFLVTGVFEVSRLFRLEVSAQAPGWATSPAKDWVGKPVKLVASPIVGPELVVHGIATRVSRSAHGVDSDTGHNRYEIELAPTVAALGIGRNHRYFQDLDVVEIVKAVLADYSDATAVFEIVGTYAKRPYTVQWGESDWTFIERLLGEEGISYRFDFNESTTDVVFFDDSTNAPEVSGGPISYTSDSMLEADQEVILGLTISRTASSKGVVFREYDPRKPTLDLEVKSGDPAATVYDYPGRYSSRPAGTQLANRRMESLARSSCVGSGITTTLRLWPGRIVEIEGGSVSALANVLVTRLALELAVARADVAGRAVIRFAGIPAANPHRPVAAQPAARAPLMTATIAGPSGKELHTDDTGYQRAQFHWDREGQKDEKTSTFMRVGQFALGGSMVRPRVGWEVVVEHQSGDADRPFIVSHLYNGSHPTPYPLPANKTRTSFQTATTPGGGSSNEVRFEDKNGSEEIFINASKDMSVAVGDTKTKQVGNNHDHSIGANSIIKVGSGRTIGVKSNQKFTVNGSETLTASAKRETNVTGTDTQTIGASRSVTVTHGRTIESKAGRSLTVGGNMMDISALGVNRAVLGSASVTVSGAWISAAAAGLANMTGGAAAETVGGVKLQLGVKGVGLSVKGALAETVGAAYVTATGGNFAETATGALSFLVGGAFIVNAPTIEIEAESEISIVVGGATSLKITSGKIELRSPTIPQPALALAKDGSRIQHNQ